MDKNKDGALSKQEFLAYVLQNEELHTDGTFLKAEREKELRQQHRATMPPPTRILILLNY